MTGANYMGGKRNAAKARTRDSTGRIQRGFFGRQRLNILSKGIPCRTPDSSTSQKPSIPTIELAHAPQRFKDLGTRERLHGKSSDVRTTTFATVPKTPESSRTKGSSSSNMARSRVLDVLDTKEPMFLRATLNRILTLPDLAGLSDTGYAFKRLRVEEDDGGYNRAELKRKKTTSSSNDEPQLVHPELTPSCPSVSFPSGRGTVLKGNRDCAITKSTGDGPYAPPEDDELLDNFELSRFMSSIPRVNHSGADGLGASSLPPSSEQTSSSDIVGTLATGTYMDFEDQDWDDSGLDLESNHWSPSLQEACEQSSIQSIVGIAQDDYGDEIAAFYDSPRRCPRFAENNLYEHQDPWHTIGVILGLSPVRPDDHILDREQDDPPSIVQSLSEKEEKNPSLDGDIASDIQNSDEGAPQRGSQYFSVIEDELDDGLVEGPVSDGQELKCALHQDHPLLFAVQEDSEEAYCTRPMTMTMGFDFEPHVKYPTGVVRTPSPICVSQSPFRNLLESKRKSTSLANKCSLGSSEVSGSLALPRSSSPRSCSSLALRTPSPGGAEQTQSPFRMLLAARNWDQNKKLNLTDYSLGDSGPSSSPGTVLASSMLMKETDGVFQGPCLFPEEEYDASDEAD